MIEEPVCYAIPIPMFLYFMIDHVHCTETGSGSPYLDIDTARR